MSVQNYIRVAALFGFSALAPAVIGCVPLSGDEESGQSAVATTNGLNSINGLSMMNGLGTGNGLSMMNGLNSINGLSMMNGLMTTSDGRNTVSYLVRCALTASQTLVKQDQNGVNYTFTGSLGFAPDYLTGACDTNCQEWISACMMAHINTAGVHVPLWIVAGNANVGWGLDPGYPNQEGSFFANIFITGAHGYAPSANVAALYCNGNSYDKDTVPGRIGANQTGAPYTDPYVLGGAYQNYSGATGTSFCSDYCTPADNPNAGAGYKACSGWNNVVTTYRQASTDAKVIATATAPAAPTLTASISKYIDNSIFYCANVTLKNKGTATVSPWTVVYDTGTATEYMHWFSTDSVSGSVHTSKGVTAFSAVAPGGSYSFGYCARYHTTKPNPIVKSVSAS